MDSGDSVGRYYGKYRGTVVSNVDPMQMGRLMVQVPDVYGMTPSTWALPCVPSGGKQMGHVLPAADRRGRMGRVRAGQQGLPDLGWGVVGQRGGSPGAGAGGPAGDAADRCSRRWGRIPSC